MTAGDVSCGCQGAAKFAQTRRASLVEAAVQTSVGYGLALATQAVVFPLAGIHHVSGRAHLGIGAAFVAVSLARGYVLRRLFARIAA